MKLRKLYHADGCGCPDCKINLVGFQNLRGLAAGDEWGETYIPIPDAINEEYLKKVWQHKVQGSQIDEAQFKATNKSLNEAVTKGWGGKGIKVSYGPDWGYAQELLHNVGVFSAFKQHSQSTDLIGNLTTADGKLKTFAQFKKDVAPIVQNYNQNYLKTEYQTAVSSARMAEKWRGFERRKDVYPNLKYVTQHDSHVRPDHVMLDGIVQPINSNFWKTYYPPNGWNCRCNVLQVDDEVTSDKTDFVPAEQFRNNVGTDKQIFTEEHPYFDVVASAKAAIEKQAESFMAKNTRKEVIDWSKGNLVGKEMELKHLPIPFSLTNQDIDQITWKPIKDRFIRNEMLYVLPEILKDLTFLGEADEPKDRAQYLQWYYYSLTVDKRKYYFNFYKGFDANGKEKIGLHSIEDKNSLEKPEKK